MSRDVDKTIGPVRPSRCRGEQRRHRRPGGPITTSRGTLPDLRHERSRRDPEYEHEVRVMKRAGERQHHQHASSTYGHEGARVPPSMSAPTRGRRHHKSVALENRELWYSSGTPSRLAPPTLQC